MISIIAALDLDRCIGKGGKIPWRLPSDLERFRQITTGHKVIMGRKTYESLPNRYRPLPDRTNIVISRSWRCPDDIFIVNSLEEALLEASAEEECFIIGGGEIYSQALGFANKIYLTEVQTTIKKGDTFFPSVNGWNLAECSDITKPSGDEFPSRFLIYAR
jgi:dihydrofolate reductase